MEHNYEGVWGRVKLKPLQKEDIEKLRILRNRERVWFLHSEEIGESDQIAWYERYLLKKDDCMFAIMSAEEPDIFLGAVALYDIERDQQTAEYGRLVIDKHKTRERGLGYDATICVCRIGFEQIGLEKIVLQVFSNNLAACKTYEKAGFHIIGEDANLLNMEIDKSRFINNIER